MSAFDSQQYFRIISERRGNLQQPVQAHLHGAYLEQGPAASRQESFPSLSRHSSTATESQPSSMPQGRWKQRFRGWSDASWKSLTTRKTLESSTREGAVSFEGEKPNECCHKQISWVAATYIMIAETISLGILSLPYAVSRLGLVPGGVLTVLIGILTSYTGYVVFTFKLQYPWLKSFPDAAHMVGGTVAQWIVEVMMTCFLVFLMASHLVIFAKELNTISGDGWQCTILFTVIGMFICMAATMPRTLKASRWCSILSCISILAATFTTLIGVALRSHGQVEHYSFTPLLGPNTSTWAEAGLAVSSIIVSFTGHIAYFNIIGEMQKPEDFPKALFATNGITIAMYTIAGVAIYYFAGQQVPSPALSAASPIIQKIAYGLATPTIIVAGVIAAIVACKRAYDVVWRNQLHVINENTFRARGSWVAIVISSWLVAFIIANVIPFFGALLGLIGAAVGTWICLGFPAIFWMHMNWDRISRREGKRGARQTLGRHTLRPGVWRARKIAMAIFFAVVLVMCVGASGFGLYGAVDDIRRNSISQPPFSCRSNVQMSA